MSRPDYYITDGPHIYYFYKGELISGAETLTDISGNWSIGDAARNNGDIEIFPDSVAVDYGGLNDKLETCTFNGGMSLPTKKIINLFQKGYIKDGKKEQFTNITTGMAPGGRICVWVDHVEIKRGIVKLKDKYVEYPAINFGDSIEINNYLKHHPVDYSIWEKPDPTYELDFGFCSEDGNYEVVFMYTISKEGLNNRIGYQSFIDAKWNSPIGIASQLTYTIFYTDAKDKNISSYKLQLPVHLKLSWQNKEKSKLYCTDIPLPKDFANRFTKPYFNSQTGKKSNYNRLVFGVEKDGEHCIIWLDGPSKQEKLMRFKGNIAKRNEPNGIESGGYASEVTYY
ncbi:hypothetical protein FLJC2902T_13110 [Flavobacterium limnosediminis JC2902]|uniref:DUF2931 family protein n=2 Tax=Flavobacterium TaxID=237 RepID=V6SWE3_9FLAO|nr:hypothetical protein FLJC2902T_13110 [Flavobacterium limnosediminis JC2902]